MPSQESKKNRERPTRSVSTQSVPASQWQSKPRNFASDLCSRSHNPEVQWWPGALWPSENTICLCHTPRTLV